MKPGKIIAAMLICAVMVINLSAPARAAGETSEKAIPLESLAHGVLNATAIEQEGSHIAPRAICPLNVTVSPYKSRKADSSFPLEAGEIVKLNCTYSPDSANVDFGLIAPDGTFYYINSTSGSIHQSISIGKRGDYTLAVSNNSSYDVSIAGYVYY